jgi:alkylation response protein AidB-like acyl-CoA dehydrogenase
LDVNFGPSDDQRALKDSARSVLDAQAPLAATRAAYDDAEAWRSSWRRVVDLGWTAAIGAEPDPGEVLNAVMLVEEAGRAALAAQFAGTLVAAGALSAVRSATGDVLEEIAGGVVAAYVPGAARDVVRDAPRADLFVLTDDTALRVHRADVVDVTPAESIDPSQPVGALTVTGPPLLEVDLPTGALAEGAIATTSLVLAAAELVGVADRAVAMGVEHATTRHQFGQPIGAFQAVKHRLADAYVAVERARSLTYLAAGHGEARQALLAKAAANEAATIATRACVAVHGAIAQTWEHDAHLLVRRAWLASALLGETSALYSAAARDFLGVAVAS